MSEEEKIVFNVLYSKYNKLSLNKAEMAVECGCSTSTLDRLRGESLGSSYIKLKKGDINYPLTEIAKYFARVTLTA